MTGTQRLLLFLFGPAVLGTALSIVQGFLQFPNSSANLLSGIPFMLIGALLFSIVPAALYAWVMEVWLTRVAFRATSPRSRAISGVITVLLSTALGTISGYLIHRLSEASVEYVGGITGCILGTIVAVAPSRAGSVSTFLPPKAGSSG